MIDSGAAATGVATAEATMTILVGVKGKTCDFNMDYRYLGTDGTVGVFRVDNPQLGLVAKARHLTTCDTLWELPSQVGSLARAWRVNTTLVQLSDDGTELMSLVAPS